MLITLVGLDVWEDMTEEQRSAVREASDRTTIEGTRELREAAAREAEEIAGKADYLKISEDQLTNLLATWDAVYREAMGEVSDETGTKLVETLYSYKK